MLGTLLCPVHCTPTPALGCGAPGGTESQVGHRSTCWWEPWAGYLASLLLWEQGVFQGGGVSALLSFLSSVSSVCFLLFLSTVSKLFYFHEFTLHPDCHIYNKLQRVSVCVRSERKGGHGKGRRLTCCSAVSAG